MIFSAAFWRATFERAISTAAQSALLAWGGGTLPAVSLPWWTIPAFAAGGAVLTVLKALAAAKATGDGPSLTNAEKLDS